MRILATEVAPTRVSTILFIEVYVHTFETTNVFDFRIMYLSTYFV